MPVAQYSFLNSCLWFTDLALLPLYGHLVLVGAKSILWYGIGPHCLCVIRSCDRQLHDLLANEVSK